MSYPKKAKIVIHRIMEIYCIRLSSSAILLGNCCPFRDLLKENIKKHYVSVGLIVKTKVDDKWVMIFLCLPSVSEIWTSLDWFQTFIFKSIAVFCNSLCCPKVKLTSKVVKSDPINNHFTSFLLGLLWIPDIISS